MDLGRWLSLPAYFVISKPEKYAGRRYNIVVLHISVILHTSLVLHSSIVWHGNIILHSTEVWHGMVLCNTDYWLGLGMGKYTTISRNVDNYFKNIWPEIWNCQDCFKRSFGAICGLLIVFDTIIQAGLRSLKFGEIGYFYTVGKPDFGCIYIHGIGFWR